MRRPTHRTPIEATPSGMTPPATEPPTMTTLHPPKRPADLLRLARPGLEAADADRVTREVGRVFGEADLLGLLAGPLPAEQRCVAALALGLLGRGPAAEEALAGLLHDEAAAVVAAAEHALWTLWLRGNGGPGAEAFGRGLGAVGAGDPAAARVHLEEAAGRDPGFAEASHQLGLLAAAEGRLGDAAAAFAAAAEAAPLHFGALAGAGHVALRLGRPGDAEFFYERALAVHPRLEGVAETLAALREAGAPRKAG